MVDATQRLARGLAFAVGLLVGLSLVLMLGSDCEPSVSAPNQELGADPRLHTWGHAKAQKSTSRPVDRDAVRASRRYKVAVRAVGFGSWRDSFVYESIPRNGNGRMYDPANPRREFEISSGDGVTLEAAANVNMAWSQFQYATDVELRIRSSDAAPLGPPANVVIRPSRIPYRIYSPRPDTILVCVPFDPAGRRFSVEFQNDLIRYRTDGVGYVEEGGVVVSEEPRNALLIFASPFISPQLVPAKMDPDVQVLKPGKIVDGTIGTRSTLYFEAGVYWVEDSNGVLGKSHIKLHPNTNLVYFEPGTYIKGALEYTTAKDFFTVGHGVLSGENYAYQANTLQGYVSSKDDKSSLRLISHQAVSDNQTWTCVGVTLNAPPFNSVDLFPREATNHEEDNRVRIRVEDYKQVGAFYFQTDGLPAHGGSITSVFLHANDDALKLYYSDAHVTDVVVWKVHNDPVIQLGWKPRNISNVVVDTVDVIHSRWAFSQTAVPSAIIGAAPYYTDPKLVDAGRSISAVVRNLRCEGKCAALLRIAPMNNYDLRIETVRFDELLADDRARLGMSLVGTKISDQEDAYVHGQEVLRMGIHVRDWLIAGRRVCADNWRSEELGQLNFNIGFWGQWSIA
nr:PREDICTED: dextranase-like isoform X2 [Bemisia tabaci]XP_018906780.1 PREDICTED: dextranase-like isoform X2 [Bemisia tabaci]